MTLIRRAVTWINLAVHRERLIIEQNRTIDAQADLIRDIARVSAMELYRVKLEHVREIQGMASGWLLSLERPEEDEELRHELVRLETRMNIQIAKLEEHIL